MPLDPSIPLQTQPVQVPNILNSAAQLIGLRNSSSELALRQAQIQQANANTQDIQAQAEDRARKVRDQNTIQEAMSDPAQGTAFGQGDFSSLRGKISPDSYYTLQQNHASAVSDQQKLTKDQLTNQNAAREELAKAVDGLMQFKKDDGSTDFDAISGNLQNLISGHAAAIRTLGYDPASFGAERITDLKGLQAFQSHLQIQHEVAQIALDRNKEQQATAASTSQATESNAKAAEANANAQKTNAILGSLKTSLAPPSGQHPVDGVLDPKLDPQANAAFKAEYDNTPLSFGDNPYAGKNAVLERAAAHAAELSPATRANKANQAADSVQATERARQQLAPGVLAGIADPEVRNEVMRQGDKAESDYAAKAGDADRLLAGIQAARSGNQAAGSMLTLEEVRSVVNRVSRQEIAQAGGGSVLRRLDNALSTGWSGAPSDATLKDLEQFATLSKQTAASTRANMLGTLNKNYGSKFDTSAQFKSGDTRVINGKTYTRDAQGNWNP